MKAHYVAKATVRINANELFAAELPLTQRRQAMAMIQKFEREAAYWMDAYHDLADLLSQLRTIVPSTVSVSFEGDLRELIPAGTAGIAPLFASKGVGSLFLVLHDRSRGILAKSVNIFGVGSDLLLDLTSGERGFLFAILRLSVGDRLNLWQSELLSFCHRVWSYLEVRAIRADLVRHQIERLIFVPQGGVGMLPIAGVWRRKAEETVAMSEYLFSEDVEAFGSDEALRRRRLRFSLADDDMQVMYLADDYVISFIPSITSLSHLKKIKTKPTRKPIVVGINKYRNHQPLKFAVYESKIIADFLAVQAICDENATLNYLVENAQNCEMLHLACHGHSGWFPIAKRLVAQNPMVGFNVPIHEFIDPNFSRIAMHDGLFNVGDILLKLDLRGTRLVVLSACETGLTDTGTSADEFPGLISAFLKAGAQGVVSSLWSVDDMSTALLMARFYQHLTIDGNDPALALTKSQRWLRNLTNGELPPDYQKAKLSSTDKVFEAPHYWAAFTYTGA